MAKYFEIILFEKVLNFKFLNSIKNFRNLKTFKQFLLIKLLGCLANIRVIYKKQNNY